MRCAVWKAPVIKQALSVFLLTGMTVFGDSPLLQYTFDEATSGSTNALDTGSGVAASGVFYGATTRVA